MNLVPGQGLGGTTARLFGLGWEFGGAIPPFALEVWSAERRPGLREANYRPRYWLAERRHWLKPSQLEASDMRPQIDKDPAEVIKIGIDFANRPLDSGESLTITGSSLLVEDENGDDVTQTLYVASSLGVSGATAYCQIQGGIMGKNYTVYFQMKTTAGQTLVQGFDVNMVRG